MIHSTKQELTLSVPITLASHHQAQLFYQRQANPHKAKQVYLNTLAVEATRTYLSWLGIESDLQASDSWNPIVQTLLDIADLDVPGLGKLECRPVLPGATTCYIPPETNADRIGYLPVLFDSGLETATLLGFVPSTDIGTETEEVSLERLQPVTSLLNLLKPSARPVVVPVRLGQWLKGVIASDWQAVERLIDPEPAFAFRNLELVEAADMTGAAVRGKLLALSPRNNAYKEVPLERLHQSEHPLVEALPVNQQTSYWVALVVGIEPTDALQSNIWVKLCPVKGDRYLPEALEVRILDDQDAVVMEAQSRQTDMLQLNFRGMLNEQFTIEVALGEVSLVEKFVI